MCSQPLGGTPVSAQVTGGVRDAARRAILRGARTRSTIEAMEPFGAEDFETLVFRILFRIDVKLAAVSAGRPRNSRPASRTMADETTKKSFLSLSPEEMDEVVRRDLVAWIEHHERRAEERARRRARRQRWLGWIRPRPRA